jgi:hypothetical protein
MILHRVGGSSYVRWTKRGGKGGGVEGVKEGKKQPENTRVQKKWKESPPNEADDEFVTETVMGKKRQGGAGNRESEAERRSYRVEN